MISACCSFNILVIRWALTWIHRTARIPCLKVVDPNRRVPDLYFKVVDPKLQVADLKAEVGELRSGGISPNLTPVQNTTTKRRSHCSMHNLKPHYTDKWTWQTGTTNGLASLSCLFRHCHTRRCQRDLLPSPSSSLSWDSPSPMPSAAPPLVYALLALRHLLCSLLYLLGVMYYPGL